MRVRHCKPTPFSWSLPDDEHSYSGKHWRDVCDRAKGHGFYSQSGKDRLTALPAHGGQIAFWLAAATPWAGCPMTPEPSTLYAMQQAMCLICGSMDSVGGDYGLKAMHRQAPPCHCTQAWRGRLSP